MWTAQGMTALTTYYLPISPGTDRYLSYSSASVYHFVTVIPALRNQIQNLSLMCTVSWLPGLSQPDVPFWQHIVRYTYIRGKNLSRSLIFVKKGGRMWCCYLSRLEMERLSGWDKATETRRRLVEYVEKDKKKHKWMYSKASLHYVVSVKTSHSRQVFAKRPNISSASSQQKVQFKCEIFFYNVGCKNWIYYRNM